MQYILHNGVMTPVKKVIEIKKSEAERAEAEKAPKKRAKTKKTS